MNEKEYKIIKDPKYGYKRLEPLPNEHEISKFYESDYYELIRKGRRGPDIRRLMAGGEKAEKERAWFRQTLYTDICSIIEIYAPGKRLLDVGCGTGEFIAFLEENGFEAFGTELSHEAVRIANDGRGKIFNCTLADLKHQFACGDCTFDIITLLNVLEHVPNPDQIVLDAKKYLRPEGLICVRVPNDFNDFQLISQEKLKKPPWWIAIPDHTNYFHFDSLNGFLESLGFEIVYTQGDFPMELFLLMGDDYTDNSEVGSLCHAKRVRFEMALPDELRRKMYASLASVGIGRECLTFGRLK